jgi:hypothetical protein
MRSRVGSAAAFKAETVERKEARTIQNISIYLYPEPDYTAAGSEPARSRFGFLSTSREMAHAYNGLTADIKAG